MSDMQQEQLKNWNSTCHTLNINQCQQTWLQGDFFSYLQDHGGKLDEQTAVKIVLEPFLSGLQAIHAQARLPVWKSE